MAKGQTTSRLLNQPQTTLAANPWQSSVIWGNGVVNNGVTIKAPTSVSNPSSLNPSTTTPPKTTGQTTAPVFSDNMTKPILAPVVTAPTPTTPPVQPISTPTPVTAPTPTAAPATWVDRTAVDKVNAETLARIEAEKKAQLIPPTTTGVPDSSTWMAIDDPNNFQMTGYTKEEFAALPDDLQQKALAQGKKNYENLQSTTDQLNYTNEVNARIANDTAQTEINKQTTALNNENANMLRNQAMREEEKSVRDLAQNIWFLGSGGRPVQSTWMLHAYADAINESNTKLNEIKMIQENQKTMEKLGIAFDANAYTERIRQLNQDLKSKTTQVFQDAINNYTQAERTWMVDSPAKMLKLQQQILMSTDISVSWFVQANLDKIAKLNDNITSHIEAVKKEAEKAEVLRKEKVDADIEFKKQANTVNDKLSVQTGFLTDGNGQIIRNSDTGAAIRYNPLAGEKPTIADGMVFEPIFNPETGETTYKKTRLYTPASEKANWTIKELADWSIVKVNSTTGDIVPYNTSEGDPNQNDWGGSGQIKLGETPIDTGIKNVYGSNVKLAPTVASMVTNAMTLLASQGIDLKIADSYRSNAAQAQAYASGKAWVAPPWQSFHELWQAFDLSQSWKDKMNDPRVFQALKDAWLKQLPWEWRHWSYGELGGGNKANQQVANPNISPLGNEALKSGTITGTPTQKNKTVDEMAKAGVFDEGLGNSNYYLAGQPVKDWLKAVTEWYDKRQQARNIYNRMKDNGSLKWATGPVDKWLNKAVGLIGWNSSDYNNLNAILQKELSTYMNRISGATVSESEVNRLQDQIPNLSMNDKQFKDAMEQYNQSMKNGINYAQTQYWFDGINNMRTKLIGGGSSTPATSNNPYSQYQAR